MGKVIEFNRNKNNKREGIRLYNEPEGIRLYFRCFESLSKSERRKVEDVIKDALFKGVMKKLTCEQILEIHGYAAKKFKQDREIDKFNEKMKMLLEKYEHEEFKKCLN